MDTTEPAPVWRRSQRCEAGTCVEIAELASGVAVRDSTRPDGPVLHFSKSDWASFTADLHTGRLSSK